MWIDDIRAKIKRLCAEGRANEIFPLAAECVNLALLKWDEKHPGDNRPRLALKQAIEKKNTGAEKGAYEAALSSHEGVRLMFGAIVKNQPPAYCAAFAAHCLAFWPLPETEGRDKAEILCGAVFWSYVAMGRDESKIRHFFAEYDKEMN